MKQIIHKTLIILFFLFYVVTTFSQQKPYEILTLDKGEIFNAKLTPDPEQKEVLSAYLKGKTTKDTLRIKIKGTPMVQNVTITVLCLDKQENINVEIAKGQWKKVERKGKTKNGFYRISFKTARDFGISIHNNKIGTPFNVIIWTSGELKPKSNSLFIPISEYNNKNNTSFNESKVESTIENNVENTNKSNERQKSNFMMYLIIAVLILISILLFMLLKKKKNKSLGLFVFLFMLSNITFSQISNADQNLIIDNLDEITGVEGTSRVVKFFRDSEGGQSDYELLTEEDSNHEPNVNPDGQPELPSSCKSAGNKNRPTRNKVKPRNNRRNTNRASTEDEDTKYDDIDRPKYDDDGNAINYGKSNTSNSQDNNPFTDDGTVVQGDGLKKDKDGNPISGSAPSGHNDQVMDDEGDTIEYDSNGRPKFDRNDEFIDYENSNRPKHDYQGNTIDYPTEDKNTIYNRNGRPRFDSQGSAIEYDNVNRPNYDRHGNLILYKNVENENNSESTSDNTENTINNTQGKQNVRESETAYDSKGDENIRNNTNRNQTGNKTDSTDSNVQNGGENQDNSKGCECLENAYDDLEVIRYQFEKLRIIYNSQEKITKYAISFGDDVSPLTGGLGGLAWQKERMKILKGMEKFYKAYDKKHLYFVNQLKDNLKEIEKCEAQLDFENWYSRVGFLYFNFMKDKYKRN